MLQYYTNIYRFEIFDLEDRYVYWSWTLAGAFQIVKMSLQYPGIFQALTSRRITED